MASACGGSCCGADDTSLKSLKQEGESSGAEVGLTTADPPARVQNCCGDQADSCCGPSKAVEEKKDCCDDGCCKDDEKPTEEEKDCCDDGCCQDEEKPTKAESMCSQGCCADEGDHGAEKDAGCEEQGKSCQDCEVKHAKGIDKCCDGM